MGIFDFVKKGIRAGSEVIKKGLGASSPFLSGGTGSPVARRYLAAVAVAVPAAGGAAYAATNGDAHT